MNRVPDWPKFCSGDNLPTRSPDRLGDLIAAFEEKKAAHGLFPAAEAFLRGLRDGSCPTHFIIYYGQRTGMPGYWGTQENPPCAQWVRLDTEFTFDFTGPHILGAFRIPYFDEARNPRGPGAALLLQGQSRVWQQKKVTEKIPYGYGDFIEQGIDWPEGTYNADPDCSAFTLMHDIDMILKQGYDNPFEEGFVIADKNNSPFPANKNPLELSNELMRLGWALSRWDISK